MKKTLCVLASILVFFACQQSLKSDHTVAQIEIKEDNNIKAMAIFWVDKVQRKQNERLQIQTVKAKVFIHKSGKVNILSFIKEQPEDIQRYLKYRLEIFKVTKIMIDSGYIKTGEQYVQLRYIPQKMRSFNP
ncbi:DUF4891 domain-containing protein [Bacteroides ihuae]|uniref:DUF4891 domain-containing protein n=1 Tax=Bacteroides ihuae TaxID=1852362 RepID=UPI0008DA0F39|nr:DUF4891 domain-containing protein [Bacteroides ihuae]